MIFFVHLAAFANHVEKKEAHKVRNHSFSYGSRSFLHTDTHVLTNCSGKEENILPAELIFNQTFQNSQI